MASMWKGNLQGNPHGSTQRLGPLRGLCPPAVVSATEGLSFQPHCGPQCTDGTKGLDATPADASWCTSNGRDCESHVGQDHGRGEVEHQGAIYLLGKPNVESSKKVTKSKAASKNMEKKVVVTKGSDNFGLSRPSPGGRLPDRPGKERSAQFAWCNDELFHRSVKCKACP